jgi:hypothetical protein
MGFNRNEFTIQLVDITQGVGTHQAPTAYQVGGTYNVLVAGSPVEVTIYSNDTGTSAASNPGTISSTGLIKFFTASSVTSVDITLYTANGEAKFMQSVGYRNKHQALIDRHERKQLLIIPFAASDNVEVDTGFTLVGPVLIEDCYPFVVTVDATETLAVGLDGTTTNDPNGLLEAPSVATAGYVECGGAINGGTNIDYTDSVTYGVLLASFINGSDAVATNGGVIRIRTMIAEAETDANITYTGSAGSDTAAGYIMIELVRLPT